MNIMSKYLSLPARVAFGIAIALPASYAIAKLLQRRKNREVTTAKTMSEVQSTSMIPSAAKTLSEEQSTSMIPSVQQPCTSMSNGDTADVELVLEGGALETTPPSTPAPQECVPCTDVDPPQTGPTACNSMVDEAITSKPTSSEDRTPPSCSYNIEMGQHEDANEKFMEDRIVIKDFGNAIFFAIYDGHGASSKAAKEQHGRNCVDHVSAIFHEHMMPPIVAGFTGTELVANVERAFLEIEEECFREGSGYRNGTTACAAVIREKKLIITNLGDSQAVLCRGGIMQNLTNLHRPGEVGEKTRIEAEGCEIVEYCDGRLAEYRLESGLAVSRSFGDFGCDSAEESPITSMRPYMSDSNDEDDSESTRESELNVRPNPLVRGQSWQSTTSSQKPRGLSALPECHEVALEDNDEFVLIACDGIYDVMDTTTAMRIVRQTLRNPNKSANDAAKELIRRCKSIQEFKGVLDNLSVTVAVLKRPEPLVSRGNPNSALRRLRAKAAE
eukprot:GEMP01021381.1.p1 GENE.GEMP01021381.1~~GEMP01021381.1.p1  ORF type:complete len:500 (+),score=102.80 GEMP01021381.1:26-1525(+)